MQFNSLFEGGACCVIQSWKIVISIRNNLTQSVNLDLILLSSHTENIKTIFTTSLLDTLQDRDSVEKKPASLLVMS